MEIALELRVFVILAAVVFLVYAVRLTSQGRMQLRYALLWLVLAVFALFFAVFPQPLFAFASLLGFEQPANFLFFTGLLFVLITALSTTMVISRQTTYITRLVQDIALLKQRVEELENSNDRR